MTWSGAYLVDGGRGHLRPVSKGQPHHDVRRAQGHVAPQRGRLARKNSAFGCCPAAPATINGQLQGRPSGALPLVLIPTIWITRAVIVARQPAAGFSAVLRRAALRAASPHALAPSTTSPSSPATPGAPDVHSRGCERQVFVKADVSRRDEDRVKRTRSVRSAWGDEAPPLTARSGAPGDCRNRGGDVRFSAASARRPEQIPAVRDRDLGRPRPRPPSNTTRLRSKSASLTRRRLSPRL
jgi:hypothetical protein